LTTTDEWIIEASTLSVLDAEEAQAAENQTKAPSTREGSFRYGMGEGLPILSIYASSRSLTRSPSATAEQSKGEGSRTNLVARSRKV